MTNSHRAVAAFGPFRLFPTARVLEKDGLPLALGDRALDILILLVERAGEVVSHRELIARVWRGLVVHPSNLRVHMAGLRKALGDGDTRYVANVSGQGYCFVAPIQLAGTAHATEPVLSPASGDFQRASAVLSMLARMVERDEVVLTISVNHRESRASRQS